MTLPETRSQTLLALLGSRCSSACVDSAIENVSRTPSHQTCWRRWMPAGDYRWPQHRGYDARRRVPGTAPAARAPCWRDRQYPSALCFEAGLQPPGLTNGTTGESDPDHHRRTRAEDLHIVRTCHAAADRGSVRLPRREVDACRRRLFRCRAPSDRRLHRCDMELHCSRLFGLWSLYYLGELKTIAARFPVLLRDARYRMICTR